jgi:hypothetical protein
MRNQLEGDTWRKQGITQSSDDNPEVTHQGMRPLCFVTHRRKILKGNHSYVREERKVRKPSYHLRIWYPRLFMQLFEMSDLRTCHIL